MRPPHHDDAVEAYSAGLAAVDPTALVRTAVRQGRLDAWLGDPVAPRAIQVLALGKAAPRMVWGLVETSVPFTGLGVTVEGTQAPAVEGMHWLAGEHPVPGPNSFAAGRRLLAWVERLDPEVPVLVLLSGGASACVEAPATGQDEPSLRQLHADLLRSGRPIEEVNAIRGQTSAIKGGRLAHRLQERGVQAACWVLQDTADPVMVGAGVAAGLPLHGLASNDELVAAAGLRLGVLGTSVYRHPERLQGETADAVRRFLQGARSLPSGRVALVGGGETTDVLPDDAPAGGRCQHAALLAADLLRPGETFAALASDGIDGSTKEAGAIVTAGDGDADAAARFAAHRHLEEAGRTLRMGPTGTNVNDLWIWFSSDRV